jgi:hypothetical protein
MSIKCYVTVERGRERREEKLFDLIMEAKQKCDQAGRERKQLQRWVVLVAAGLIMLALAFIAL